MFWEVIGNKGLGFQKSHQIPPPPPPPIDFQLLLHIFLFIAIRALECIWREQKTMAWDSKKMTSNLFTSPLKVKLGL